MPPRAQPSSNIASRSASETSKVPFVDGGNGVPASELRASSRRWSNPARTSSTYCGSSGALRAGML